MVSKDESTGEQEEGELTALSVLHPLISESMISHASVLDVNSHTFS